MDTQSEATPEDQKYAITFIQPTDGLIIKSDLGEGESFSPLLYLTNNRAKISNLLGSDIALVMGGHFHDSTSKSEAVIYLEGDISSTVLGSANFNVDLFVHYCMEFLISLWLVKDHAIALLPAVLRISRPGTRTAYRILTFGQRNFDSLGKSKAVEFAREEIRNACEYNQDWVAKLTRQNGEKPASIIRDQAQTNFETSSSRLLRFLCMLEHGRTIPDLGIKLGLFCSCLECLFSQRRTNSEITHRVAERAAFLLKSDPDERRKLYKRVKDAYDLRSSVLHGSVIEDKELKKLPEACVETDAILRQAFTKIILNPDLYRMFTEDENRLQEFFLDILFAGTAREINQ